MSAYARPSLANYFDAVSLVSANKFIIDVETHREMLALIRSVPAMNKSTQRMTSTTVDEFLRNESPVPEIPELEMLPVFPRTDNVRVECKAESGCRPAALKAMSELPISLIQPVAVKEDEEDLAEAHLVVVDGWRTYLAVEFRSISTLYTHTCRSLQDVFACEGQHSLFG